MSGVATLKIRGSKRHFDEMAVDLPIPSQACSPNRFSMRPPPLKRGRCVAPSAIASSSNSAAPAQSSSSSPSASPSNAPLSPTKQNSSSMSPSYTPLKDRSRPANTNSPSNSNPKSPLSRYHQQHRNPDTSKPSAQQQSPQQQHNDKQKVVVSTDDLTALARHLPRRLKKQLIDRLASGQVLNNEKLFTLTDLREIVNSVISEHDSKMKEQFTTTLNERLAEQFRDFTKFNEDYVSRQLRGTDVAYLS